MKQSYVKGRVKGLSSKQRHSLELIIRKRHPIDQCAEKITLENFADIAESLKQNLHMIIDAKGVCRLIIVGCLNQSTQILSEIIHLKRSIKKDLRLITCSIKFSSSALIPDRIDAIAALDLEPISWLFFASNRDSRGLRNGSLWSQDPTKANGWNLLEQNNINELCHYKYQKELPKAFKSIKEAESKEKAILLTLSSGDVIRDERNLAELEGLVRSAGIESLGVSSQSISCSRSQTIWGKGKLQEVALEVRKGRGSVVITDRELNPGQVRNLERILDCPVIDRSELILDIFAQRANSSSGRLQVELAQLRYRLPRLTGRGRSLSRQGGGIGTRGPGETQLEKDRRAILRRLEKLGRDLKNLQMHRSRLRQSRKNMPRVALVGYTNSGKSSLLNSLCNLNTRKQVLAENKLFATLETTTRRLIIDNKNGRPNEILVTDTVGFIQELPAQLLEAFRATLEETLEADLLLILFDLSSPDCFEQCNIVNHILDTLGASSNRRLVANKIDLCESLSLEAISSLDERALYVSATSGAGMKRLKQALANEFWPERSDSNLYEDKK